MFAVKKQNNSKVTYLMETVTPEDAQQILKGNTNNRTVKKSLVKYFKNQIERGIWQFNGDAIRIAANGTLLDGQHRLLAVIAAKKPITTLVVRGLSTETFKTIDTGCVRTIADHLHIEGFGASNILGAAVKVAMRFDGATGVYTNNVDRISPTEIIGWLNRHETFPEFVKFCMPAKGFTSVSTLSGVYYICSIMDPDAALSFFTGVVTGERLSAKSPAMLLRNRLLSIRNDGRAGAMYQKTMVALIVHAFNCYRKNKPIERLVYGGGDIILDGLKGAIKQ